MKRITWEVVTRTLAVVGFVATIPLIAVGADVPWGWFILLVGLFFGPDAYAQFGPGDK